ncbi:MAG: ABC transporter permease [Candidatus Ancaeobacter aquaticus]|nr:ABC transporter permease [Candidatus Ancaeobacter aquaticus]
MKNIFTGLLGFFGRKIISFLRHVTSITQLTVESFYWIIFGPFRKKPVKRSHIVTQMIDTGVHSLVIVIVISFFVGLTMAMLLAYQLRQFGSESLISSFTAIAFTRELGPLMTAIVISGRVGASFTAELGTMKVSEEIMALETSAINPVRYLISPRLLAMIIMVPCLVVISDVMGMIGGFVIGKFQLGIESAYYIDKSLMALQLKDIVTGMVKSVAFAIIICMVGCYYGFIVEGGAEGVGKYTTVSVVCSLITVVAADCFFTALFYFVFI